MMSLNVLLLFGLLVAILAWARSASAYSRYYETTTAVVQIESPSTSTVLIVEGQYFERSSTSTYEASGGFLLDQGCPEAWNNSLTRGDEEGRSYVLFLHLSDCGGASDVSDRASKATDLGAAGVVVYTTSSGASVDGRLSRSLSIPVVFVQLRADENTALLGMGDDGSAEASIQCNCGSSFPNSQTFYFIVFSFSLLMVLSCSWFLLSYVKRCQHNLRSRRRRNQDRSRAMKEIKRLPVRTFKASSAQSGEWPLCAICLDAFCHNDSIRILACEHEFHLKCVDPWLKLKRTCPLCKQDIANKKPASCRATNRLRERGEGEGEREGEEVEMDGREGHRDMSPILESDSFVIIQAV